MPSKDKTLKYCIKCRQTMSADNFYTSRDADKYPPDGKLPICKDCTAMHVNAWDESTFMDILQDLDLPYLPDIWKSLIEAKGNSPREVTGRYILGRYIARMRLAQYRKYRFSDSQALQEKLLGAQKEAFQAAGLDGEALQAELDKLNSLPEQPEIVELSDEEDTPSANSPSLDQSLYYTDVDKEILSSLTPEDIRMLRNKWGSSYRLRWGSTYRPEEWLRMEQLYTDMMNSYDIQGAGHKDTLIMICKASLKANQLIDAGDIEGFQRVQKAYDSLMKSGKFDLGL